MIGNMAQGGHSRYGAKLSPDPCQWLAEDILRLIAELTSAVTTWCQCVTPDSPNRILTNFA